MRGRQVQERTHYTVTVFAGVDMYTQLRVPITMRDNSQAEYEYIMQQLIFRMEEEFGVGVELSRRTPGLYDINVDHVLISG